MSIEIGNVVHALAVVSPSTPVFFGQGNVGFAPFGVGPEFSQKVADGRVRMHLLDPINFVRGEGLVLVNLITQEGDFPLNAAATIDTSCPPSGANNPDILIQTRVMGVDTNVPFMILVLRFPQQSTGP